MNRFAAMRQTRVFRSLVRGTAFFALLAGLVAATPAVGQCTNTSQFPSTPAAINTTGASVTITTCSFAGEYSAISGAVSGQTLTFTSSVGTDLITVRSGTPNGPVVASGTTPQTFSNTFTGTLYAHWNTPACGSQSTCRTTTVRCTNCPTSPVELQGFTVD